MDERLRLAGEFALGVAAQFGNFGRQQRHFDVTADILREQIAACPKAGTLRPSTRQLVESSQLVAD